jgi:hypothetical protein
MSFKDVQNKLNVCQRAFDLAIHLYDMPDNEDELVAEFDGLIQELRTVGWDKAADEILALL